MLGDADAEVELGRGAELHGVGGDREVAVTITFATGVLRMLIVIRGMSGNGSGGGLYDGWKPPTVTTKLGSSPNAASTPHLAVEGHVEDAGVVEDGEEPDPLGVELDGPDEGDLDDDQRGVLVGDRDGELADDGDVAGDLDDHAERQADQGGRAPAELRHRPDQEDVLLGREERRAGRR